MLLLFASSICRHSHILAFSRLHHFFLVAFSRFPPLKTRQLGISHSLIILSNLLTHFRRSSNSPNQVIHRVASSFAAMCRDKSIRLTLEDHASSTPNRPSVMGDSMRLGQVLSNFLSNAVRFTGMSPAWLGSPLIVLSSPRILTCLCVGKLALTSRSSLFLCFVHVTHW